MMKKILLPIDGSEACFKSYEYAKDLAEKFGSEILIFNAQNIMPAFGWSYEAISLNESENSPRETATKIVEEAKKFFANTNIKVSTKITVGDPAGAILDVAEKENCDMIIMCTHGMSRTKRFLLGSVTNKVVHHATIPVLVIR